MRTLITAALFLSFSCDTPVVETIEPPFVAEGEGEGEGEGETVAPTPDDMIVIDGATFTMGSQSGDVDEEPEHAVSLSAFAIDRTEVSQRAYAECVDAGACEAPEGFDPESPLPVVRVTFDMAMGYCAFKDRRLPTEAEWEYAARGADGRTYPWGDDEPSCGRANTDACGGELLPVGEREAGASPFGVLDMAGNAWEWVADFYSDDAYANHDSVDPQGPPTGDTRVYRGGSYGNHFSLATTTNRASTYNPAVGGSGLSFRCARTN